jgi:hypothetical protein
MQNALRSEKSGTTRSTQLPAEAEERFWRSLIFSELDSWYPQTLPVPFQPTRRRKPRLLRIGLLSLSQLARPWIPFRPSGGPATTTRDP